VQWTTAEEVESVQPDTVKGVAANRKVAVPVGRIPYFEGTTAAVKLVGTPGTAGSRDPATNVLEAAGFINWLNVPLTNW
jgi:hypothetical protein